MVAPLHDGRRGPSNARSTGRVGLIDRRDHLPPHLHRHKRVYLRGVQALVRQITVLTVLVLSYFEYNCYLMLGC